MLSASHAMKYKLNTPEKATAFLDKLYLDVLALSDKGINTACIEISGDLDVTVELDGQEALAQRVHIEIQLTNIDDLGEDMAATLGSMVWSLIAENNLREFEYSASELSAGLLGNAGESDCEWSVNGEKVQE